MTNLQAGCCKRSNPAAEALQRWILASAMRRAVFIAEEKKSERCGGEASEISKGNTVSVVQFQILLYKEGYLTLRHCFERQTPAKLKFDAVNYNHEIYNL